MYWYAFYLHSYHLGSFLYFMFKKNNFYKERKFKFSRQKFTFHFNTNKSRFNLFTWLVTKSKRQSNTGFMPLQVNASA